AWTDRSRSAAAVSAMAGRAGPAGGANKKARPGGALRSRYDVVRDGSLGAAPDHVVVQFK
ncbi:MAG: hypothetical protein ACREJ0_23830, partial [Geminicoccaceae bacterium]